MTSTQAIDPYLSTAEASEWLRTHGITAASNTVREWCKLQRIAAFCTPGGQYRIRVSTLVAMLAASGVTEATAA